MSHRDDALALVDSRYDALHRDASILYDEMLSEYHRLYDGGGLTSEQLDEMLRNADLILDIACRYQLVSVSAWLQRRHRARFVACRRSRRHRVAQRLEGLSVVRSLEVRPMRTLEERSLTFSGPHGPPSLLGGPT